MTFLSHMAGKWQSQDSNPDLVASLITFFFSFPQSYRGFLQLLLPGLESQRPEMKNDSPEWPSQLRAEQGPGQGEGRGEELSEQKKPMRKVMQKETVCCETFNYCTWG